MRCGSIARHRRWCCTAGSAALTYSCLQACCWGDQSCLQANMHATLCWCNSPLPSSQVENISLLSNAKANGFVGVNMWVHYRF